MTRFKRRSKQEQHECAKVPARDQAQLERCVRCGAITGVDKNSPIDTREHYISGCGQFCRSCYFEINPSQTDPLIAFPKKQIFL